MNKDSDLRDEPETKEAVPADPPKPEPPDLRSGLPYSDPAIEAATEKWFDR